MSMIWAGMGFLPVKRGSCLLEVLLMQVVQLSF